MPDITMDESYLRAKEGNYRILQKLQLNGNKHRLADLIKLKFFCLVPLEDHGISDTKERMNLKPYLQGKMDLINESGQIR